MNQNELYAALIVLPAIIMMMAFVIGLAVVVITDSDKLLECLAKALVVLITLVGVYEIAIITYVAMIKLIN